MFYYLFQLFFFYMFFNKQPKLLRSSIKNGLKIKQLAKQPPTLKMLLETNLVELWVKSFTFPVFSSPNLNFSATVFDRI